MTGMKFPTMIFCLSCGRNKWKKILSLNLYECKQCGFRMNYDMLRALRTEVEKQKERILGEAKDSKRVLAKA